MQGSFLSLIYMLDSIKKRGFIFFVLKGKKEREELKEPGVFFFLEYYF